MTNDSQTSDATQIEPRTLYLTRPDEHSGATLWLGPNSPVWKEEDQSFNPQKRCSYLLYLGSHMADMTGIRGKQCLCFVELKPEE